MLYNKIKEADVLIFAFPIWWGIMPAILKGFIDKVFLKDFAYIYTETGIHGILNKNAVVTESMARSTDKIIIVIKISGFEFSFIISLR